MPSNFYVLAGSRFQITNTDTTTYNILRKIRIVNIRDMKESDSITAGNREKVVSAVVESITGTITSKTGKKVAKVTLSHVIYQLQK